MLGGQRHAPAALPPGKTRCPLYRRLGGTQGRSGHAQKSRPHLDSIPGPPSPQQVAIPTELCRPIFPSGFQPKELFYIIYNSYFNDGLSNKVSNIIRRLVDNVKLLLICILLLSHYFIFFRFYFLSMYIWLYSCSIL
jgi:hypothetical protein